MRCHWWKDQRGSILLFTTMSLVFLMVIGGFAIDLAYEIAAKSEVQRSMDAAALAGAGNLGFDDTVFPTVRQEAWRFGNLNPYRVGTVDLNLNPVNDTETFAAAQPPYGDIVLGIWDGTLGSFTPSLDGTQVNAVLCRYKTAVPTSFLRLIGVNTLEVRAQSIAVANPPATVGCDEPILPIGVTSCNFFDAGTGAFNNSSGCGTGLTFISSQTICDNSPGSPQTCNTATWVSLDGSNPNTNYLINKIQNAGDPDGSCSATLKTGDDADVNNGMIDPVFKAMADAFVANRADTLPSGDVCAGECDGSNVVYPATSGGWETGVVLLDTECPPGPMGNTETIATYSHFVVTQVFYKQQGCVLLPNPDPQAEQYCYDIAPDGTKTPRKDNDFRAIFGYFRCGEFGDISTPQPVPRAAVAPRLRLVQ